MGEAEDPDPMTAIERLEAAAARRPRYVLRLFVAGSGPRSARAIERAREICETHLGGRYDLEIVDVHQTPDRAGADDVFAIPTLLKELPATLRSIIGDLSDEGQVLVALGIGRDGSSQP